MRIYSVYIIDDHFLIRNGIKTVFENTARYKIIGEAEAAELAYDEIVKLQPDILIIDFFLKGTDGISLLKKVKAILPDTKCLMLSSTDNYSIMQRAKENAAMAFINKQEDPSTLLQALDDIIDYDTPYFPKLKQHPIRSNKQQPSSDNMLPSFIPSELQVIYLLLEGYSTLEIAKKLNKSYYTISSLRKDINKKTKEKNFKNFTHFASYAKLNHLF